MREHGQKTDKLLHFGAMAFSDLASNLARALPKGWLRGVDLNHRPLGYEPNELPGCSTPHLHLTHASGEESSRASRESRAVSHLSRREEARGRLRPGGNGGQHFGCAGAVEGPCESPSFRLSWGYWHAAGIRGVRCGDNGSTFPMRRGERVIRETVVEPHSG